MTDWKRVRPRGNFLLVEIDSDWQTTDAGILLGPGKLERERLLWATVLKTGDKVRDIEPGQRTLVARHAGWLVLSESPEVVIVKDEQCEVAA